jgi:glycosyltransferase involved in cell wall biosynthesis
VLSQFAKGILTQSGLPAERIRVRPNWSAGPKTRRSGPGDYFAYLGRFSPEKGITKLLDAWGDMNHSLVIAGSGQLAPAVVEAAGSSRRIEYRGQLARSDCDELLAGARALIVPSRCYEGFPLVVAEAMAAGVPVIGPNHGPFPEIITHGETGHLFDGTVEGLRSAVSSLASDSTSTRMGIAARRDFEERFSKEAGVAGLEAIYQEVVARPGQIESEAPLELGLQRTGGM